jgi:hypothetical protein
MFLNLIFDIKYMFNVLQFLYQTHIPSPFMTNYHVLTKFFRLSYLNHVKSDKLFFTLCQNEPICF